MRLKDHRHRLNVRYSRTVNACNVKRCHVSFLSAPVHEVCPAPELPYAVDHRNERSCKAFVIPPELEGNHQQMCLVLYPFYFVFVLWTKAKA